MAKRKSASKVAPLSLAGRWYNELGSTMKLKVAGSKISGQYQTKVGDASGWYDLVGRLDRGGKRSLGMGFVVSWQNAHKRANAVTAWSGQLQRRSDGSEVLLTTWLLTEETKSKNNWKSTIIGQDEFNREPQTASPSRGSIRQHAPPHPAKA
jgi:Avidin family